MINKDIKKCKECKHRRKHICNEPCASCNDNSNFEARNKKMNEIVQHLILALDGQEQVVIGVK